MNEREIFLAALEKPKQAARREYLDTVCADDQDLRRRVEDLLTAKSKVDGFLEVPPPGLALTVCSDSPNVFDQSLDDFSLDFLAPSDIPGCLGTIGQYQIVGLVGRGGFGLVLRAYDPKLNRIVAIKVMSPELATNPTSVKRFLREAQAAAAVRHDHVVTIHSIEEASRPPFIVMEYVEGQSLKDRVDQVGELEVTEILRIGAQIASGLSAAHQQGLVHRDIKPANILLENGIKRVKITDFGLARAVDDVGLTQTGLIAGTPQYMSPEQGLGQAIDARSDLFSLGSVLYTLCTGGPAFCAESAVATLRRVCDDMPRSIRAVNPDIPDWLEQIVTRLLAKSPDDRFQSADEVSRLLGSCLAHVQSAGLVSRPVEVGTTLRPSSTSPRYARSWFVVLVGLQMAAIIGSLAAAFVDVESIVFTGPVFGVCLGSAIAYAAYRARRGWKGICFGLSSVALTLLIVLVINMFGLGPLDATPIQILITLYALAALPWGYKQAQQALQGGPIELDARWVWKNPNLLYAALAIELLGIAGSGMVAVMEIEAVVVAGLLFGVVFAGLLNVLAYTIGKHRETRIFAISAPFFAAILLFVIVAQDWSIVNNAYQSRLLIARAMMAYAVISIPVGLWAFAKELELFGIPESRVQFSLKAVLVTTVIAALAYSGARPCLAFGADAYFGGILFVMTLLFVALLMGVWFYQRDKKTARLRWVSIAVALLLIQTAFMGSVASYDVATDNGRFSVRIGERVTLNAVHSETGKRIQCVIKKDGQTHIFRPTGEWKISINDRNDLVVVPDRINIDRFNRREVRVKRQPSVAGQ